MPKTKETDRVTFVAEYRDGTFARFDIDAWTLRSGDWVARIIARERQQDGSLKLERSSECTPPGGAEAAIAGR
jgi:hypothetical protein